jgi:drug/metabolite transporter (DMT)-like permease
MTETTFGIIFWMAVIQLPFSLIGSDLSAFLHLGWAHLLPALGVGISGTTSHYCLSNAFRQGDATLVVPLDFMRIPLIAIVGWIFFNETLDIFVFLGAAIIIAGVLWNLRAEANRAAATSLEVSE